MQDACVELGGQPSRRRRRWRAAVLVGGLLVGAMVSGCGATVAGDDDARGGAASVVSLIGERTGILIWRPVEGATRYRVEILTAAGAPEFASVVPDTIAPLPPTYTPGRNTSWWVRAYRGERQIAASPVERLY